MLSSISPVGEAARRQRWPVTVAAYVVGSTAGGAAAGALAGAVGAVALGWLDGRRALLALAVVTALALLGDLTGVVPSWHRQVDEHWLDAYRGWVYGLGYGVQLGAGVLTIVPSNVVVATLGAAALTRGWGSGAAVGITFGLGRALPLLLGTATRTVAALRRRFAAVERWRRTAGVAAGVGQAAVALLAFATSIR